MNKRTGFLAVVGLMGMCVAAFGVIDFSEFPGWAILEKEPDIIVARCLQTPDPLNLKTNGIAIDMLDGLITSDIESVAVLKGTKTLGRSQLISRYWPHQGDYYLIFGFYHDGSYQAVSSFRVIRLGHAFSANYMKGDSLDEKVRSLLHRALNLLNEELKNTLEEKKHLEESLK